MRRLSLIVAAFALVLGACERHTWEDEDKNKDGKIDQNEKGTVRLYNEEHGEGEEGHGEEEKSHQEGGEAEKEH